MKFKHLLLTLLLAALLPWAVMAQTPNLYTSYIATAGITDYQQEGYPYLVDNDINTKWCVGGFSSPNNLGLYIEFYSTDPITPTGYVLTTGDDNATWTGRNPKDWTIKAKANPNDEWTTIASVTDDQVLQDVNFTDFEFTVDNPNHETYQYFRFDVSAIQSGGCFQLAELRFMVVDLCDVTNPTLTVNNIKQTTVNLSWPGNPDVESYKVKYRTTGTVFTEGFENGIGDWTCIGDNLSIGTNAYTGSRGFNFVNYSPYGTKYLISPELSGVPEGMKLEFYHRSSVTNTNTNSLQVGFSSTDNATESFTFSEIVNPETSWSLYSTPIPAGTKYICLEYVPTAQNYAILAIDDIMVGVDANVPTGEWQTATVAGGTFQVGTTLTNLTPSSLYETYVYPNCNPNKVSNMVFFITLDCPTLTNLTVSNIGGTIADISWTVLLEVESYTVKYRTAQTETVPAGDWHTLTIAGNNTEVNTTLTGLSPETYYEVNVFPDCNPDNLASVYFITENSCPTPRNIAVCNITTTTANLCWTGEPNVECYTVEYQTRGDILNEDFGEDFEGWTLRDCGLNTGVISNECCIHSGNGGFYFTNNYYTPQYLISPELTGITEGMKLEFYYKNCYDIYSETIQVGFSATDNATESFTFGEEITASDEQWHLYSEPIPAGTKYICWKYSPDNNTLLFLDDIAIGMMDWQTVSVAGNAYQVCTTLTNLIPAVQYAAHIYPDCNPDMVSETVNFTMADPCPKPTDLNAGNINTTTANLSWTGDSLVDSYTINYRISNIYFIENFQNGISNWTLRNCDYYTHVWIEMTAEGNAFFDFSSNDNPPQYLISPKLTGIAEGMKLEFRYRSSPSGYPNTIQIGFSSTDDATESFTFGDEITTSVEEWQLYSETIPAGTRYICWKYLSNGHSLHLDDIIVSLETPPGEWQTATVAGNTTDVSSTLNGLTPCTPYEVFVYPDCNPDKVSKPVIFMTEEPPFHYATDFESGCDWTLVNGDLTNQWTWGTAAHNGNGTHGLYISNDGGTTNAYNYTYGNQTMVYAYKTFFFEEGFYRFSYDWEANGESNYDFLRVALIPDTLSLEAGTELPSGFNYNVLPEGWIALDGGSQLNMTNDWQTMLQEIEIAMEGRYMMVFAWCNDNNAGANPPAAIDNVSIDLFTCPTPVNLTVSNLTATTAKLGWTALIPTDSYTVNYRTAQPLDVIFNEGFENGLGDWTMRDCDSYTGVSSNGVHSGNAGFQFCYNTTPPQYLISPELTGVGEWAKLEFYYKNMSYLYPETFQVGFSVTDNETASFTFGSEINVSDEQWHLYSKTIPAGTKYICWKLNSNDQYYLYIDDIVVVGVEVPASAWQTATVVGNTTEVSKILKDLTPETEYEAFVYPDCDPELVSETVSFTTPELCQTPTNFSLDYVSPTTAELSWSASRYMDSYTVNYKARGNVFTEGFENGLGDWTIAQEWSFTGVGTDAAHSGSYGFMFEHHSKRLQYLFSPELTDITEGLKLEFYYKNWGEGVPETFQVGFSSTDNVIESFTFGDEITVSDAQWHLYSGSIPAGTKYICFKYFTTGDWFLYLDDISIGVDSQWQTVTVEGNTDEVSTTLTDLMPATSYEVYVYPDCDPELVSETLFFNTIEDCPRPENLTVSYVGATTADLSWTGVPEEESYTMEYREASIVFSEGFENGIGNWTLRNCNSTTGILTYGEGIAVFQFNNYHTAQYLISPELIGISDGMKLEFEYYIPVNSTDPEAFKIGFSSTDNATDSFTFGDEITVSSGQHFTYSEPIPAGTKYICWKYTSNLHMLYIDNIMVGLDTPAGAWQTVTVAGNAYQVSTTLAGLSPETSYEVHVYPDCDPNKVSESVFFVTEGASTVTQTLALSTGWNWVSLYVEGNPIDLLQSLESALGENATQISSAELFTENDEGDWWGDLDEEGVTNEQMYMILVENACTITLQGNTANPANPADHAITINPGWNWIGFPCDHEMTIEEALGGFDAEDGDVFANSENFTEFDGEWFGDVAILIPGQGFMYFSNSDEPKTLIIGSSKGARKK